MAMLKTKTSIIVETQYCTLQLYASVFSPLVSKLVKIDHHLRSPERLPKSKNSWCHVVKQGIPMQMEIGILVNPAKSQIDYSFHRCISIK